MKTTAEWLQEVKTVPGKLEHWLERQYVGEALAAHRIYILAQGAGVAGMVSGRQYMMLNKIANDEAQHTIWIRGLLEARGIAIPEVTDEGTRYWEPILGQIESFEEVTAAGHHAEEMRLVRIRALAADEEIDADIREVFARILPDEEFHAKAFATLSTPEAIEKVKPFHEAGLKMLSLVV